MEITKNNKGDIIALLKDNQEAMILNYSYWECDCSSTFVRPISKNHCQECGADRDDSPIANDLHVQMFVYNTI